MTRTLRDHATEQLEASFAKHGPPSNDHSRAVDRQMRHLIAVGQVPDDILEAMPEVSRHNEPQVSPQEYECGCVTITRVTDRDCRTWRGYDEKPFEMRLALPCAGGDACKLAGVRGVHTHELYDDETT